MNQTNELTPKQAAECRLNYPPGTRILLEHMADKFVVPNGTRGTVGHVDDAGQIHMRWDNGRTLAIWRLRSHDRFGGTWLSDYVENELNGYIHEQPKQSKPDCPLIGADGNIFNLIGLASRTLRENQMAEQALEMRTRVEQSRSYHAAVSIIGEYVNFCTQEECQKHEETHEMSME